MPALLQLLLDALALGMVQALFALGLALLYDITGMVNLAHGAVFLLGSYAALALMSWLGWALLPALAGAMVLCAVLGGLTERLLLHPLRARQDARQAAMIATLGLAGLLSGLLEASFGRGLRQLPAGAQALPAAEASGWLHIETLVLTLLLIGGLFLLLRRTAAGRQLRAVGESSREAALLGIQVERVMLLTAALAGALGGAAGVLGSLPFAAGSAVSAGSQMLLRGVVVLLLGGLGSLRGAVLGGMLLGLGEVLALHWWPEGPYDSVALGLLLLTLLLRPAGLFTRPPGAAGESRA